MKNARKRKNKVQLEDDKVEGGIVEQTKTTDKKVKRVMNFDLYFQTLMRKNKNVQLHHKAPMRKFAESKGLTIATEEDFDKIFKKY